jgi:hypothetical protein
MSPDLHADPSIDDQVTLVPVKGLSMLVDPPHRMGRTASSRRGTAPVIHEYTTPYAVRIELRCVLERST